MVFNGPNGLVGVNFWSMFSPPQMVFAGVKEPNGPVHLVVKPGEVDKIMTLLPCLVGEQ